VPSDSRRVRWTINNARQLTLKIDNRHIQLMDHRMNLKSKPQPKDADELFGQKRVIGTLATNC